MATSLEPPVPPRKPRQRPAPSQRDQQIYIDYQATGKRQIDLAEQHKLTQTRISQIIRRVENWLHRGADISVGATAGSSSSASLAAASAARERLERRLQYERLNEACRLALRNFHEQQKSVTHKKGTRAGKEIDKTTERLLPANLQCLKVVLQANSQLSRLSSLSRVGSGHHDPLEAQPFTDEQLREQAEAWLAERREEAEQAKKIPFHGNSRFIIRDLVSTLLGEPNSGVALNFLAEGCDKKVVKKKSYDDDPPQLPPRDGWYYPMYDADGSMVGWLPADQFAGVISPDFPPLTRAPDSAPSPETSRSSTSPLPANPPQPSSSPDLTPISMGSSFYAPQ